MAKAMSAVPATQPDSIRGSFANIGVRQLGDPVLKQISRPVVFPKDAALASEILDCLHTIMKSARKLHNFSRGIGMSAPQIGFTRRVAIVQPRGELPIRLINPQVVKASRKTDVRFEGCLSFFDFRGEVRRPIAVTIEYDDLRGQKRQCDLVDDAARLALHEVDHLDGYLYIDRMTPQDKLLETTEEYP